MGETSAPRDIAIEKATHPFYEQIKQGKILPELKNYEMAYIFIFAMAYGVHNNKRKPLEDRRPTISKNFLENNFGWLIRAAAIQSSPRGVEIIPDEAEIYHIAEEYANWGINYIKEEIKASGPGQFEKDMENELIDIINNMKD